MFDGSILEPVGIEKSWPVTSTKNASNLVLSYLLQNSLIQEFLGHQFYCENCQDDHPYDFINGKRYKDCPEDSTGSYILETDDNARNYTLNWNRLRAHICEVNFLQPWKIGHSVPGIFSIGSSKAERIAIIQASSEEDLLRRCHSLHQECEDEKTVITTGFFLVGAKSNEALKKLKTKSISFEALVGNNWILSDPKLNEDENEIQTPKVIINQKKEQLFINGQLIQLKRYLYLTALILSRAEGRLITATEFERQYYQASMQTNSASSGMLKRYCSDLNKAIMEEAKIAEKVFASAGKQSGYRILEPFLPVKIL